MHLENTPEWHRKLIFNFISFTKVSQLYSKFAVINEFLDEPLATVKLTAQAIQKKGNYKILSSIRLEISIEKINELMKQKQICAADIRCLDADSKQCLTKLCLQNCLTRIES